MHNQSQQIWLWILGRIEQDILVYLVRCSLSHSHLVHHLPVWSRFSHVCTRSCPSLLQSCLFQFEVNNWAPVHCNHFQRFIALLGEQHHAPASGDPITRPGLKGGWEIGADRPSLSLSFSLSLLPSLSLSLFTSGERGNEREWLVLSEKELETGVWDAKRAHGALSSPNMC